jgi:hypothetical protein
VRQGFRKKQDLDRGVSTREVREREHPEPSSIWLNGSFALFTSAIGTSIAALSVSDGAAVQPSDLWIVTGAFALAGLLCLTAHLDVNRGRKTRVREIEEPPPG